MRPAFQFHKGTIKTRSKEDASESDGCFNSIKVRLRLDQTGGGFEKMKMFQFHKGTIKTGYQVNYGSLLTRFNSIKVRLRLSSSGLPIDDSPVSIP